MLPVLKVFYQAFQIWFDLTFEPVGPFIVKLCTATVEETQLLVLRAGIRQRCGYKAYLLVILLQQSRCQVCCSAQFILEEKRGNSNEKHYEGTVAASFPSPAAGGDSTCAS